MFTIDMTGHAAVVIGGSRGIGAAVCRALADAGACVAWTHSGGQTGSEASAALATELERSGAGCLHRAVDAADAAATAAFIADVVGRWGRLDHLVYNAGFTAPKPFQDITPQEWRRMVDVNLNGAFYAAHAAIPHMLARRGGSLVLIGSAAIVAGGGGRPDYPAAKAGLEGLSRALTKQFAPQGIRCNVVHPSLIETDMLRQRHPDPADRRRLVAQVPMGRLGRSEDIADAVVFLLSDKASYIVGQSLFVDGGRTFCR